jgi:hypothetical protein
MHSHGARRQAARIAPPISRNLLLVHQWHENHQSLRIAHSARDMSFAADVLSQQNRPWPEAPLFAVADCNFHFPGQVHDELTPRCFMPVDEVLSTVGLAKILL